MKKALIVASVASMIDQFNMPNILLLQKLGYSVAVACNFEQGNTCNKDRIRVLKKRLKDNSVIFFQIDFARNVAKLMQNWKALEQIDNLLQEHHFDLIHCHSPIGGLITRFAARNERKKGTCVIYTAHGFHFFKGAPTINWLLYFPAEWICAYWTDVLITINKEDYVRAQKWMHARKVEYIPGVGVDIKKFSSCQLSEKERIALRQSLGVSTFDKMLLSVGELSHRKDHETAIRAIASLNNQHIKYFICGQGRLEQQLQELINKLGVENQIKLLGFRNDVSSLCDCADLFVFPSLQEGLPVALMEAIASKLPVVCSNIRGNTDLVGDRCLFNCGDIDGLANKIKTFLSSQCTIEIEENYKRLKSFDFTEVLPKIRSCYENEGQG